MKSDIFILKYLFNQKKYIYKNNGSRGVSVGKIFKDGCHYIVVVLIKSISTCQKIWQQQNNMNENRCVVSALWAL